MADFWELTLFMTIAGATPGPNNIISLNNGIKIGLKNSYTFNLGVLAGRFTVNWLLTMFGATIISFFPTVQPYLRSLGGVYILYLAYKVWKSSAENKGDGTETSFFMAFMLQFINIKSYIVIMTAITVYILPNYGGSFALTIMAAYLAFFSFTGTCCWALFGSIFQKILSHYEKTVNIIMALLLVYCAVSLYF